MQAQQNLEQACRLLQARQELDQDISKVEERLDGPIGLAVESTCLQWCEELTYCIVSVQGRTAKHGWFGRQKNQCRNQCNISFVI
ncbi:hypothetical protein Nepgr_030768 [Nepenthes gracilis]|uniref:Uncharacterized protein n=1 Tax=Nepenthes gracilis TaxID=150966 RepID=A0AAD3TF72_NEPGR|nr:hypothetical protein Nepgr_030768 [Nepenthes gracilis]